jgi:alpha-amylase
LYPFNDLKYFHDCSLCPPGCWIQDFANGTQVEQCQLYGSPDLNQDDQYVRATLKSWISELVANYSIDGLRVDTIPYVKSPFWSEFQESAGVYAVGECAVSDVTYAAPYQESVDGMLSYPLFFTMRDVFSEQQSMYAIEASRDDYEKYFKNIHLLGTFIDNHDNGRFLYEQPDLALYENAIVYTLLSTGIPIIYYGTEQYYNGRNDPYNREPLWLSNFDTDTNMYQFISMITPVRKTIGAAVQLQLYVDDDVYFFTRGQNENSILVCTTNVGELSVPVTRTISSHPYITGNILCNL